MLVTSPSLSYITRRYSVSFSRLYAWTGLFIGVYMLALAAFDLCALIRHVTRFTYDLFAVFVCTIYLSDGIKGALGRLHGDATTYGEGLFSLLLFTITLVGAVVLDALRNSALFTRGVRRVAVEYALPLAVAAAVAVSYSVDVMRVERVYIPDSVAPTGVCECSTRLHRSPSHAARSWA
jgi:hypothetical protein